jgi:hypothetical protein
MKTVLAMKLQHPFFIKIHSVLNPVKSKSLHLFKNNPVYFAVAALFFLQIPILIAGNRTASSRYVSAAYAKSMLSSAAKSLNEVILEKADSLYNSIHLADLGLGEEAFQLAYKGYYKLVEKGVVGRTGILTIADFSKPSSEKRLYVIDMDRQTILFNTLVAHGRNSGLNYANDFSNKPESYKSSLGFYLTMNPYMGENGYSLRLKGLEYGINHKAFERAIVMHGSDYVSKSFEQMNGYLGRSYGCPAVPVQFAQSIIQTIKDGSVLFIYHPAKYPTNRSTVLNS